MRYYPVFLDLRQRSVVVAGVGVLAAQKAARLEAAGATVRRIARLDAFDPARDLDGAAFVLAASRDAAFDRRVADAARARGIPVNVADVPALSTAILPAVVDRGDVTIAIGTGGAAPVLARRIRERIEAMIEPAVAALARFAARHRGRVQARVAAPQRRRFWEAVFDGEIARLVRDGHDDRADAALERALDDAATNDAPPRGHVSLVGAGSGDAGLLTLRALRALQDADVIFHDALVDDGVLALARAEAERVDVGKRHGAHGTTQDHIHAQLRDAARAGRRVVRLKCGDPLTFARGGEELEYLRAHGIPYDVVPGVTAAQACAAYAGIALTHRDHAQSVRFVTAHCAAGTGTDAHDDGVRLHAGETLVLYMGVARLAAIVATLVARGAAPSTPVAIVENGGRATQRVMIGELRDIVALAEASSVQAPALLIVGEVAALGHALHWFGASPITATPPVTVRAAEPPSRALAPVAAAIATRAVADESFAGNYAY